MNKKQTSQKVLFLYSELAAYFLACVEHLHLEHGYEVHVVHWPINPEAPFEFRAYKGVQLYPKAQLDTEGLYSLYEKLNPDLVYSIGWMDPEYKAIARRIKAAGTPVIAGMDNHWTGNLRQRIACLISPFYLKPFFSHIWIPGKPQLPFAQKLGFPAQNILTGLYSADTLAFDQAYERFKQEKQENYPHSFLYVGRFVEVKGVMKLLTAFDELRKEINHNWTLKLVGTGNLIADMQGYEQVEIHDFVQAEQLPSLAQSSGCFILPSIHEPWGVALHEFAAAGLPLISSHTCGAASAFLKDSENGYTFSTHTVEAIKESLRKIINKSDHELNNMSQKSHEYAQQISPKTWSKTLLSVID